MTGGRDGYSHLAQTMQQAARQAVPETNREHTGRISADGLSVLVSGRSAPIPLASCARLRLLLLADPMTGTDAVAVGDHGAHSHQVVRPLELAPPEADAEVVLLWAPDHATPIVLGVPIWPAGS